MAYEKEMEVINDFINSVNRTPEEIKEFFGVYAVEDKEQQGEKRYNIYRFDGELLLENQYPWELGLIIKNMAIKFADVLRN